MAAENPKKATAQKAAKPKQSRNRTRPYTRKQANEDAVTLITAEALRDDPRLTVKPEMANAMLLRFIDLLGEKLARRPAHRPATEVGLAVQIYIECGLPKRLAILRVMAERKLEQTTVKRRYREYLQHRAAESKP